MKRLLSVLLALILACCLVSALADEPANTEGIDIPVISGIKTYDIPDNEAMAFLREMKMGWNLGNTFDAYSGYIATVKGTAMETSWIGEGAETTEKLIETLHEAGFNTIRIPVSWHNHVDADYRIAEEWMARVREVADWALSRGMYVIVNVHHDNHKKYFYPDEEHFERSSAYLTAVWQQIAEAFADCDDHLILESLNEPRLVDTDHEWWWDGGSAECREAADCINRLNQLFVDTIRATGGNNATRYLAVPAYDASPYYAAASAFVLPQDTAENRIIVEAHAYTPYSFALEPGSKVRTFDLEKDSQKKADIDDFLGKLYQKFISKGIPVMMDEFGAMDRSGNLQDRVNFAAYYVAAASARGITCLWWDNHAFSGTGELFGLINRKNCKWVYPDIVLAMRANCLYGREQ